MDQLQQLLDLLKETPEMALWGLAIWCIFILLKLASWIYALKIVAQQFIKRYFNWKEKSLNNKRGVEIAEFFENNKISSVDYTRLIELLNAVRGGSGYFHESDIITAIKVVKDSKNKR
tara:strand:+ start:2823 stop:3176 length:354 start_codon:yes stop_codon:yes gene_type:complete